MKQTFEKVAFAGGCFWCTEALFKSLKGIVSVTPGYTGGRVEKPTYEQVSSGDTGHAEAVLIEYDPSLIAFDDLLAVFFNTHDPTALNRQGNDVGTQYRSAIFWTTAAQKQASVNIIAELELKKSYDKPVVTTVEELKAFYEAEEYHKNYYETHEDAPYCELVIAPKLEKLEKKFAALLAQ